MAEISTDNLIINKFADKDNGYPSTVDTKEKDVIWYSQNSYDSKNPNIRNQELVDAFAKASKSGKGVAGKAEFVIDTPDFYVIVEDKDISSTTMFSGYTNVKDYIGKGYDESRLYKCPIDDVLWYANFVSKYKDVIAVANYSDGTKGNFKSATFFMPKDGTFKDLVLICEGNYDCALLSLDEYKSKVDEIKGNVAKTYETIYEELKTYANQSSSFMYNLGIDDANRLGLVSIIVLALQNKKSDLYNKIKRNEKSISQKDIEDALLEATDATKLGLIIQDELSAEKKATLENYIKKVLLDTNLTKNNRNLLEKWDKSDKDKLFADGDYTILSRLVYSLNNNILNKYEQYKGSGIDIMGTFYSLFLIYYASDKKKGIVLTPTHITNLFCDLAEYFSGKKFTKDTIISDICTGSGGFLIAALNRIDKNIDEDLSLTEEQKKKDKKKARKKALVGTEIQPHMFMLAYANMRFHGDGKSTLFNFDCLNDMEIEDEPTFGSSLRKVYDPNDDMEDELLTEVFKKKGADIGMINPPYGKGFNEFDFIEKELEYLKKDGIGIAIVPVSNQGISKNNDKTKLLEKHTLLASILMPNKLFVNISSSGASVGTCILVFKAHKPHQEFREDGGKVFLADWREDGYKMVNKHGRFEDKDAWKHPVTGYRKLYLDDMDITIKKDYAKQRKLDDLYNKAFNTTEMNVSMIPSTSFKKDIHDGGIKSIMVDIYSNPHTLETKEVSIEELDSEGNKIPVYKKGTTEQQKDKKGNLKWKMKKVEVQVPTYDNMDWNILNYVKTDYSELTDADFIKTLRNYKLFEYMTEKGLLFSNNDSSDEDNGED